MCREAGVRNLKKLLEKIYRKAALKLVKRGVEGPAPKVVASDAAPGQPTQGASFVMTLPPTSSLHDSFTRSATDPSGEIRWLMY